MSQEPQSVCFGTRAIVFGTFAVPPVCRTSSRYHAIQSWGLGVLESFRSQGWLFQNITPSLQLFEAPAVLVPRCLYMNMHGNCQRQLGFCSRFEARCSCWAPYKVESMKAWSGQRPRSRRQPSQTQAIPTTLAVH